MRLLRESKNNEEYEFIQAYFKPNVGYLADTLIYIYAALGEKQHESMPCEKKYLKFMHLRNHNLRPLFDTFVIRYWSHALIAQQH